MFLHPLTHISKKEAENFKFSVLFEQEIFVTPVSFRFISFKPEVNLNKNCYSAFLKSDRLISVLAPYHTSLQIGGRTLQTYGTVWKKVYLAIHFVLLFVLVSFKSPEHAWHALLRYCRTYPLVKETPSLYIVLVAGQQFRISFYHFQSGLRIRKAGPKCPF